MKVTAIIPDELVKDVKRITRGTNITESIIIALQSFTAKQKLLEVMEKVRKEPLVFKKGSRPLRFERLIGRCDYLGYFNLD